MRKIYIICLSLQLLQLCSAFNFSLGSNDDPFVSSSLTNNSFDFVVYKDHFRTKDVFKCYDYIYKSYQCLAREKQMQIVESLMKGEERDSVLEWLERKDVEYIKGINDELKNTFKFRFFLRYISKIFDYPALYAHIRWSGTYSRYISEKGNPGVWSCFIDFLEKEYQEANDYTLNNNVLFQDGKMIKLYSGIRNPVIFNISKSDGSPNVKVNDLITVSGYLSTTSSAEVAIDYAFGHTGAPNHPIILDITPLKEKSKTASLHDFLSDNTQYEYLFPTNVAFRVKNILKESEFEPVFQNLGLSYVLVLEETETKSIHKEVEGRDPDEHDYTCQYGFSSATRSCASVALFILIALIFF